MTVSHKLACVALESEISNLAIIFAATAVWSASYDGDGGFGG